MSAATLADDSLLAALYAISNSGFPDMAAFLTAFLSSADVRVQKLVDRFMCESFEDIMELLMNKSFYGPTRRRTAKRAESMSSAFGKQLLDWVIKILSKELGQVACDSQARLSPSNDHKPLSAAIDYDSMRPLTNIWT